MPSEVIEATTSRVTDAGDEDVAWIRAVVNGQQEAFAELVRKYESKIRGYCQHMLKDSSTAEDASQEVFLKAYTALPTFREDSKFSTWLFRIASNYCIDIIRRKRLVSFFSLDAKAERKELNAASAAAGNSSGKVEAREILQLILRRLPADCRSLLILRELYGLSYEELAETLGCNIEAVKSRLKRARRKLLLINSELGNTNERRSK